MNKNGLFSCARKTSNQCLEKKRRKEYQKILGYQINLFVFFFSSVI